MIFFTMLFSAFPIFALIAIPAIFVTKAIDCHGVEDFTKEMKWYCVGYGLTISAGISAFMAAIAWVAKVWIPWIASIFGAL